jgi:hypothetical protein
VQGQYAAELSRFGGSKDVIGTEIEANRIMPFALTLEDVGFAEEGTLISP